MAWQRLSSEGADEMARIRLAWCRYDGAVVTLWEAGGNGDVNEPLANCSAYR